MEMSIGVGGKGVGSGVGLVDGSGVGLVEGSNVATSTAASQTYMMFESHESTNH